MEETFYMFYFRTSYYGSGYTVVSRIYAPRFATLALVESVGGGLYAGSDILSCEYAPAPLPVSCLDVDMGTLYYRAIEAADLPSPLILSSPEP